MKNVLGRLLLPDIRGIFDEGTYPLLHSMPNSYLAKVRRHSKDLKIDQGAATEGWSAGWALALWHFSGTLRYFNSGHSLALRPLFQHVCPFLTLLQHFAGTFPVLFRTSASFEGFRHFPRNNTLTHSLTHSGIFRHFLPLFGTFQI